MNQNLKYVVEDDYNLRILNYKEEPFCIYKYEPVHKLSIVTWSGYTPDEEVIEGYKYIGLFCKERRYHVVRTITDIRTLDGSFDGSNKWLAEEYMPIMVKKYGYRYTAIVKPDEFYATLALEAQMQITKDLFVTKLFNTFEDAYAWIIDMPD